MHRFSKKSGGGPQTPAGKVISSKNAIVHGATSPQVTGAKQREALEAYLAELIDFYQPASPLESLQLERIAVCRVKLEGLYELERVKLQIAVEDLHRSPELVMQKVTKGDELTQSFALALSNGRPISLPMGLTIEILGQIAKEINGVEGRLDHDDNIHAAMPEFGKFADELASKNDISSYSAILRLGETVNKLLNKGNEPFGKLYEFLKRIEAYRQGGDKGQSRSLNSDSSSVGDGDGDVETEKINEALAVLLRLNNVVQGAKVLAEDFTRMRDLMSRSVTLSGEESDRLMRYQTTWERRLSSAIGELLTLQDRRGP